jgi:hypothetical protein
MNPKTLPILALVLLAGLAGERKASALVVTCQIFPTNISDFPVSVQVTNGDFGERFTVFYKTNSTTLDKFLYGQLEVSSEDRQIASSTVEKTWTTNGVEFEFTVSAAYLTASKFTISEWGHMGNTPMSDVVFCWFYLRDFATNNPSTDLGTSNSGLAPDIIKALPKRMQSLRPGMTADQVWKQLFHKPYEHCFAGEGYPEHERWWLTWNYEAEFYFEALPTNRPYFDEGKRKLIRAVLYKNGRVISRSKE